MDDPPAGIHPNSKSNPKAIAESTATVAPPQTQTDAADAYEMIRLEAGCFNSGDNNGKICVGSDYQKTEVSQLKWGTYDEAMNLIRPYNLEKKEVLTRANDLLKKYRMPALHTKKLICECFRSLSDVKKLICPFKKSFAF